MRVVFWQNMMAIHQSAHIRALAATPGCEVVWVVQQALEPERASLGWTAPEATGAEVHVDPDGAAVAALVRARPDQSVHIFSGLHGYPVVEQGLAACLQTTATLGLLAERQDGRGWKGLARLMRARTDWARLQDRLAFVLAIGDGAPEWYARCGCPSDRVYPYGYFMETPEAARRRDHQAATAVSVLYVGSLVHGKGVDVLLDALAQLTTASWVLDVVGDGPQSGSLSRLVALRALAPKVRFHGRLPHSQAMAVLAGGDLLVLPSRRKDGWGAVVSEALMRGVPAVCTNECGAGSLLREPWRGEVVRAGSIPALRGALDRWIGCGCRTPQQRQRIIDWSQCITGGAAAQYLLQVIQHACGSAQRPAVPWWT